MELTPAELTVLGLIIERPSHGYDLEQVIEQRGIRQWTDIGFSSIYYLLTKLERRGFIEAPETPATARSRRVFHATDTGREIAARTSVDLLAQLRPVPQPFLVGVANLPLLADAEYRRALGARLDQVEARIAALRQAEQAQGPLPLPAREVFSYSLSLLEAERSWLVSRAQVQ
ncbi:PadR family transcriptional regulator [Actinoalloteichus hymeniacidonis]|uniref:Transcriptional regulator n=1 Tax=Actinoalloteichus hymeniacidonis TaxID=340345 RepID=A0AAC9HTV6_9PSEU|nr:PadR family transcriptional regulator [Actinoalloteichus hymeniacidonis]AOS65021.1 putative transcriptional regulator [Actinoalloteichus hymeniacidonis]MBB5906900.1 DNA-binding PadR family transcriptional regulator [Actinoalloteichus hymeniacidonis]